MKKLFPILMVAFAMSAFVACGDKNEGTGNNGGNNNGGGNDTPTSEIANTKWHGVKDLTEYNMGRSEEWVEFGASDVTYRYTATDNNDNTTNGEYHGTYTYNEEQHNGYMELTNVSNSSETLNHVPFEVNEGVSLVFNSGVCNPAVQILHKQQN